MPHINRRTVLTLLGLVPAVMLARPVPAQIRDMHLTLTPAGAVAEVTHALRQGEILTVTARFIAVEPGYPGEVIYAGLTPSEVIRSVYRRCRPSRWCLAPVPSRVAEP